MSEMNPSLANDELTDTLHEYFLSCGEIMSGRQLSELISDVERHAAVQYSNQQILASVWNASERFVDSMQDNAYSCPEMEQESYCAQFEAMRPSVKRVAAIEAMTNRPASARIVYTQPKTSRSGNWENVKIHNKWWALRDGEHIAILSAAGAGV